MATLQESSSLFAVFILTIMALFLVPYTIFRLCRSFTKKTKDIYCQCSQCLHAEKYRKSFFRRVSNFLTCSNLTLIFLWVIIIVLIYYIEHISHEIQPFEPFNILGLEPGASKLAIKKAYRRLSIQYHPDKNSDPEAHKYFVEYISKAYQALTDPISRDNFLKYGHPDGRQGFQIGIALPKFLLNFDGESGGFLLLCMVGICVLLPLIVAILYLSRSSKYTRNFVMHQTQSTYHSLMKPSLVQRKVIDVFIKAAEFMEMPVCKGNDELLQKLFMAVKSELNLELANLKAEQAKFWRRHPSFIKTELLIHAHLTRAATELYLALHRDYRRMLEVAPRLLEELMKNAVKPRSTHGHGWLMPAVGVLELAQCITQAVPISARNASSGISGGIAPFLQLPHFNETTVKKIVHKKVRSFGEFRGLSVEDRKDLLTEIAGLSAAESQDVESVIEMIPSVAVEVTCVTEGEKGIHEGDLVTVYAWIILQRNNGLIAALPHAPYYPFHKEENFWFLLADSVTNEVWMSRKVSFMDEASAVSAASMAIQERNESLGFSSKDVDAAVRVAIGKVKSGSRLVLGTFQAPREGKYNLIAYCFCDTWIGCDVERAVKLEVLKRNRAGKRGRAVEDRALGEEDVEEGEEEEVIQEGDDHANDYSDDSE